MAGLHVPLLTLRNPPCGWPRIARGRSGSLLLDRTTLAFATPRRLTRRYSPSLSPSIGAADQQQAREDTPPPTTISMPIRTRGRETTCLVAEYGCGSWGWWTACW